MTDIVEDARAVLGTFAEDMLDILRHSPSFDNMIGIADLSMRSLVQQPRDRPLEWFIHATNEWLMGDISPNVDTLIAETGLSGRQVERLTNRIYCAPPHLPARKYRPLRIASTLSPEGLPWKDRLGTAFSTQP